MEYYLSLNIFQHIFVRHFVRTVLILFATYDTNWPIEFLRKIRVFMNVRFSNNITAAIYHTA